MFWMKLCKPMSCVIPRMSPKRSLQAVNAGQGLNFAALHWQWWCPYISVTFFNGTLNNIQSFIHIAWGSAFYFLCNDKKNKIRTIIPFFFHFFSWKKSICDEAVFFWWTHQGIKKSAKESQKIMDFLNSSWIVIMSSLHVHFTF